MDINVIMGFILIPVGIAFVWALLYAAIFEKGADFLEVVFLRFCESVVALWLLSFIVWVVYTLNAIYVAVV